MLTTILLYIVGFWLLFRSIWGVGEAIGLQVTGIRGWGWLLMLAIMSIIASIIFIVSPFFAGIFVTALIKEVQKIISSRHGKARRIIPENEARMNELTEFLIKKETLTGEEFMMILQAFQARTSYCSPGTAVTGSHILYASRQPLAPYRQG